MPKHTNLPGSDSDANFIGWQENLSGSFFPLYTITVADHPSYQSTVSEASLRRLGLRVPRILSPYPEIEPSSCEEPLELKTVLKQDALATMQMDTDQEYNTQSEVVKSNSSRIKDIYKVRTQVDSAVPTLHEECSP